MGNRSKGRSGRNKGEALPPEAERLCKLLADVILKTLSEQGAAGKEGSMEDKKGKES